MKRLCSSNVFFFLCVCNLFTIVIYSKLHICIIFVYESEIIWFCIGTQLLLHNIIFFRMCKNLLFLLYYFKRRNRKYIFVSYTTKTHALHKYILDQTVYSQNRNCVFGALPLPLLHNRVYT